MLENYGIKDGYQTNGYLYFDDRNLTDQYQRSIYQQIADCARASGVEVILDVGCGSGYKLVHQLSGEFKTIGMEIEPTLSFLRETYPGNRWELSDFSRKLDEPVDMAISVDVIEHVVDPDALFKFLIGTKARIIAISTPNRGRCPSEENGPPGNRCHVREWSLDEFFNYVVDRSVEFGEGHRFDILSHTVHGESQLIVFERKS